ncbi:aldose 1-epimerase family protein [Sphingobium subterraneum]|uniref:Galactose mutarotase-like enzyme n=1 Tax=Sphingobium subterraneum TaxID=627688 RepID=A0A841J6U5_9SPHN|nr:galactose mutarotase-like enzyme [Sphingobium subterraneum]
MADPVAIRSGAWTAQIHPLGAELWSLTDAQGREWMTDADPAFWTGHAPLLFPVVGRLRGDRYRLDGTEYALPQHGFARRRDFGLVEQDKARVLFRLDADEATHAVYPFAFRLDMDFALDGATLAMTATVENRDNRTMPFSFGYHPAFAWPLPTGGAKKDHRIVFEQPEPAPIRRIGGEPGLIAPDAEATPVEGDTFIPTHALFERDAVIWDQLTSRSLLWGVPGEPRLRIDFPDTPTLGLWQKPGANYLCIEPWAGMADPAGFTGDFTQKPGIITLAPGASRRFRMNVTLVEN